MKRNKSHKFEEMFGLSASDRKQLADAFACALVGHPIKWRGKNAKRIWKKYVCKE